MARNYTGRRFTKADVDRVAFTIRQRYKSIYSMDSFLRAYDLYAKGSYIARSNGYIPTESDASYLEGSDPDNFCANVAFRVFYSLKLPFGGVVEKREEVAPASEINIPEQEYGKADKKAGAVRGAVRFKYVGKEKGRVVYARRIFVTTKYGRQVRYIDNYGRYVGVKK